MRRKVTILSAVGFLVFWAAGHGMAQAAPEGMDGISRVTRPLVLDGKMGDPAWTSATVYGDFQAIRPNRGGSPSERTEAYLAYDAKKLYVAIRSFDHEPKEIRAATATRDHPTNDDWVAFCLDSENDALSSLFFMVTPRNVQSDGTLNASGSPSFVFNTKWESKTSLVDDGWIAEMAIPLKSLPHKGNNPVKMAFKVARFISRKSEEADFPEIDSKDSKRSNLDQFRKITLHDIVPSKLKEADVFRQTLEELRRSRLQLRSLPYEEQLNKWGDASVLDYLVFPSRELKASPHPIHFRRAHQDHKIAALLEKMEYSSGKPIQNLERFLTRSATTSFIVIKDDTVLYENYFNGYHRDSMVTSFSVAKSFDSALVGLAIEEGRIASVRDPITKYLPELATHDPRFALITIRDLLQMSAGIRYSEEPPYRDNDVTYQVADLRKAALEKTAIVDLPGKSWVYNNYHPLLIGMLLERVTGKPVTDYLQEKLWSPLGMEYAGSWSVNGDQDGLEKMESGINARAIDFAKFGRLFLKDGRWEGKQILSQAWVEESTQPEEKPPGYYHDDPFFVSEGHYYKYFWWGDKRADGKSDFCAVGNKGQYIYISPEKELIIVRNGFDFGLPTSRWLRLFRQLADSS